MAADTKQRNPRGNSRLVQPRLQRDFLSFRHVATKRISAAILSLPKGTHPEIPSSLVLDRSGENCRGCPPAIRLCFTNACALLETSSLDRRPKKLGPTSKTELCQKRSR